MVHPPTLGRVPALLALLVLVGCSSDSDETAPSTEPETTTPALQPDPIGTPLIRRAEGPPANLLIISVDTLRRDHIGRYAPPDRTSGTSDTPFLDARLNEAVALDDFQSCGNSTPVGFLCLYTGRATWDQPFQLRDSPDGIEGIPADLPWASRLFSALGFRTGTATASPMMGELISEFLPTFDDGRFTEWAMSNVTETAFELAEAYVAGDQRWMLHVHYMEPHAPWKPPDNLLDPLVADLDPPDPGWTWGELWARQLHTLMLAGEQRALLDAHVSAHYRGSVQAVDAEMQRLWDGLDARGALDNTLVVFWSDHGEQLGERGRWTHGLHVHQEELGALGAFWYRGITPASVQTPTDTTDILPTVLDALGVADEAAVATARAEMTGYAIGTIPPHRARLVSHSAGDGQSWISFRVGQHALIYDASGSAAWYDMANDPAQRVDRFDADDPDVRAAWTALSAILPELENSIDTETAIIPPGLTPFDPSER